MRRTTRTRKAGLYTLACMLSLLAVMAAPKLVSTAGVEGPPVTVNIAAGGQECEWVSTQTTVGGVLEEFGIGLGAKDRVNYKLDTKPTNGMTVRVTRITERIILQTEPIGFKTIMKFDPASKGETVVQEGKRGEKEVKYLVTYKDGVKTATKVLGARVMTKPVSKVVAVSRMSALASRHGTRAYSMRMSASAYAPFHCGGSKSGRAATGIPARKGVVAVDPRVIPLGTNLYVEGYGYCVAADTGGAIKGNRIDLCFDTYREAIRFGRRTVTVHILK